MAETGYDEEVVRILENEELGEADKIKALHERGFSRKQLIDDLGFSKTSVYRALPVHAEKETGLSNGLSSDGLPVLRKMGGGIEIINPEAVLRRYTDGSEVDEIELRGMMKLRAAMLMVMDLVNILKGEAEADARRVEPILKLMKETREEQDAAAARARGANLDVAREAAQEAVADLGSQVLDVVKGQQGAVTPGEKSMAERMLGPSFDMMGQQMSGLFGNMFRTMPGFGGGSQVQGLQPQPIGEAGQQTQEPPQQDQGQPPGPQFSPLPGWEYKKVKGGE